MYSPDNEQKCATCQMATPMAGSVDMVCKKYGVVPYNHCCKRYKYDVFKRPIRRRKVETSQYSADDFSID